MYIYDIYIYRVLTEGSLWSPISFHKSRPVKNPTVRNVNTPVYFVLKNRTDTEKNPQSTYNLLLYDIAL